MHNPAQSSESSVSRPQAFRTTHWSVVVSSLNHDSSISQEALNYLCRMYWYPVFHFVRRRGYQEHDAQDLTQAFFARLVEKKWLHKVDPQKGRFRSFLLMILKRFMASEWKRAGALKRAGNLQWLSLSLNSAETRFSGEPVDHATPEQSFEKQWAMALLETVMQTLRRQYARENKTQIFDALKPCLLGSRESQPYVQIANDLGLTESSVKVKVHRLRRQYRECLKAEIAHTVASPSDVEEELKHLIRVLGRG